MADLKSFGKSIRDTANTIERNVDRTVRRAALAVDATVVLTTPVDTGRARANWQVELNQPAEGTIDPYQAGEKGSTSGQNSRAAIEQGKSVIAQYQGGVPNASIHITNNLPYIGRLNEGYSAQAPAAFVEKAVNVAVSAIQGVQVTSGIVSEDFK